MQLVDTSGYGYKGVTLSCENESETIVYASREFRDYVNSDGNWRYAENHARVKLGAIELRQLKNWAIERDAELVQAGFLEAEKGVE